MGYKLKLDIFEGPLDLLLYLIKRNDIDISDIPITEITAQYMEYIEVMKMLDLDIIGDFLVMAATLMQIKSRMLLPPDPNEEGEEMEEDPRDELVRRLQEYKRFKEIAEALKEK
jgi:segregation and condensation protein A